jgi:EpsI family protein
MSLVRFIVHLSAAHGVELERRLRFALADQRGHRIQPTIVTAFLHDSHIDSTSPFSLPKAVTRFALIVLLLGYATSWQRFLHVWRDNRSYGLLAAASCVWLLWQERHRLEYERADVDVGLTAFGAALSLGWLAATVINVQVLHLAILPIILLVWVGAVWGRSALRRVLPSALIFLLAVPVWELLTGPLQRMTAVANGVLVAVTPVQAVVEGNFIRFPFGTIEVAQSCSGLSYFMTALTISVVLGQMTLEHTKAKVLAIVVAVSLAIVGNWLRVFGLVVIGFRTKMQSPLMNEHATYGWVIFSAAMIWFFLLTRRIERYDAALGRRMLDVALLTRDPSSALLTRDPPGAGSAPQTRLIVATLALLLGPLLYFGWGAVPKAAATPGHTAGIAGVASWVRAPLAPDTTNTMRWSPAYHGASERESAMYAHGSDSVQVDRLVYSLQSQDVELVSSKNRIAAPQQTIAEWMAGPLDENLRIVSEAVVRTPSGVRLVWSWYRVAGSVTSSPLKAKMLELIAFVMRGPPSELITASTPCGKDSCAAARAALFRLVAGRTMPR